MNDVRRRGGERSHGSGHLCKLRAEPELELPFEDVERVRVLSVDVRLRTLLARLVAEPSQRQLIAVGEDADRPLRPVEDRLALAKAKEYRTFGSKIH